MRRHLVAACALAAALALQPARSHAGFADPNRSYEDPCLVACPAADSTFTMILRNSAGFPWPFEEVALDFCACPRVRVLPGAYSTYPSGCAIWQYPSYPDAVLLLQLAAGGVCGDSVAIRVGGIVFPTRALASFDQDGDLVVTHDDVALVQAKVGTTDRTADFDCDGTVTAADVAIATQHLGHGQTTDVPGSEAAARFGFSRPPTPNPAGRETRFAITLPRAERLEVFVADLTGRRIATLWDGALPAGEHSFRWQPGAAGGVRAGVYVVSARAAGATLAKRLIVLR